ncbi:MAG: hypothetical protein F4Y77_01345 [Holophagales bacterium]|nr:hypothetical protein [Holophagales bacterium]
MAPLAKSEVVHELVGCLDGEARGFAGEPENVALDVGQERTLRACDAQSQVLVEGQFLNLLSIL